MLSRIEYNTMHNSISLAIRRCAAHIDEWSSTDEDVQNSIAVKNLVDALQKLETFIIVEGGKDDKS